MTELKWNTKWNYKQRAYIMFYDPNNTNVLMAYGFRHQYTGFGGGRILYDKNVAFTAIREMLEELFNWDYKVIDNTEYFVDKFVLQIDENKQDNYENIRYNKHPRLSTNLSKVRKQYENVLSNHLLDLYNERQSFANRYQKYNTNIHPPRALMRTAKVYMNLAKKHLELTTPYVTNENEPEMYAFFVPMDRLNDMLQAMYNHLSQDFDKHMFTDRVTHMYQRFPKNVYELIAHRIQPKDMVWDMPYGHKVYVNPEVRHIDISPVNHWRDIWNSKIFDSFTRADLVKLIEIMGWANKRKQLHQSSTVRLRRPSPVRSTKRRRIA